jgi:AraC family transcriptional regulator
VASRVEVERGGARATKAVVGDFDVQLLTFAPRHYIPRFEFDQGYLAVVLDGALVKTFARETFSLAREDVASLPAGAVHTTSFGPTTTRVVCIRGTVVERLRRVCAPAVSTLGRRLAVEVRTRDVCWGLAAEGIVLQLVAEISRDAARDERAPWVREVRDRLHERVPDPPGSLSELAALAGVHPAHLARCFRREFGQSVGDYARALRLDWAAEELARRDASLASVALRAGFSDQSHFTRAFRRHTGVTPGRYRELVRA